MPTTMPTSIKERCPVCQRAWASALTPDEWDEAIISMEYYIHYSAKLNVREESIYKDIISKLMLLRESEVTRD
ncbi:hypothetical protein LCGC14_0620060 [marine sediment metagenome]|uniref:Uncharacterized protein n=1 Tax=marine sediment metagenome TaxID=412755 RepID=A0A0F9RA45_9ZZZZ